MPTAPPAVVEAGEEEDVTTEETEDAAGEVIVEETCAEPVDASGDDVVNVDADAATVETEDVTDDGSGELPGIDTAAAFDGMEGAARGTSPACVGA